MATTTPNLLLTKPAGGDAALISVINTNMDILDNAVTLAGTQSLTNKTLTSPHFTTPVVDSGGLAITAGNLTVTAGNVGINVTPSANTALSIAGTITASGSAASGFTSNATLAAAANSDQLYGAFLGPTFTPGAFTGLTMHTLNIQANSQAQATAAKFGIAVGAQTGANGSNYGVYINAPSGASGDNIGLYVGGGGAYVSGVLSLAAQSLVGTVGASGGSSAPPAQPVTWWILKVNSTDYKIALYNV